MVTITETVTVTLTPEAMAAGFWAMDSGQQAAVFAELAKVIKKDHETNPLAYSLGELQWHYLAKELDDEARSVLMSIAAPLYLRVIEFSEGVWDVNHGRGT